MKKTALFTSLFFFCFLSAQLATELHAQSAVKLPAQEEEIFAHPMTEQTTESFRAICAQIAKNSVVRGSFNQEKRIKKLERSMSSSGDFLIVSDMGMVWDTFKPFPSTLVLGKDYMIQSRRGGQKTVINADGNETFLQMSQVLSAVFSGDAQNLENNFKIFFKSGSSSWEIGLKPLDNAVNMFAQRIIITGDNVIKSVVLIEKNNDSIKYMLSNHKVSGALTENEKYLFTLP